MEKNFLNLKNLTKTSLAFLLIFVSFRAISGSFIRVDGSGAAYNKTSHIHACRAAEINAWNNADSNCYRKSGNPAKSKVLNSTYGFISCNCDHEAQGYNCIATAWVSCGVN